MTNDTPPEGWYDDQKNPNIWRWWDGERWTTDTVVRRASGKKPTKPPSLNPNRGLKIGVAVLIVVLGIVGGFVLGFMISFGACFEWKTPAPDCDPAEEYAPLYLPVLSLLVTVPLAINMSKKKK